MADDEKLPGGPMIHHGERTKPFTLALGSDDTERLEAHIARHFGQVQSVFHEILSDLVHIDVHHIAPSPEHNFVTLVTTGMSDLPMAAPDGYEEYRFAELLIHLPSSWPVSDSAFHDENVYWPVRLIKTLARFPHEYDTWLWWGHTLPNGNPPTAYDPSVEFTGSMLKESSVFSPEITSVECANAKTVQFFAVAPLYPEEVELKLRKGAETLLSRWNQRGIIPELVTPTRANVAKKKWWFF